MSLGAVMSEKPICSNSGSRVLGVGDAENQYLDGQGSDLAIWAKGVKFGEFMALV